MSEQRSTRLFYIALKDRWRVHSRNFKEAIRGKFPRTIDRNGDIYQMVNDTDCANHCMGANSGSIGIEHVGSETDSLAAPQATASAALIRWLLQEHQIPRTNIFGHDFTPGYCRPGGTSCPDKLFGPTHSQATIAAWVAANV